MNEPDKIRIENWSIVRGMYDAPECGGFIHGEVYGHPRYPDGKIVTTSRIVKVLKHDTVKVKSGNVYLLGEPEQKYVDWCRAVGGFVPTSECKVRNVGNDDGTPSSEGNELRTIP